MIERDGAQDVAAPSHAPGQPLRSSTPAVEHGEDERLSGGELLVAVGAVRRFGVERTVAALSRRRLRDDAAAMQRALEPIQLTYAGAMEVQGTLQQRIGGPFRRAVLRRASTIAARAV